MPNSLNMCLSGGAEGADVTWGDAAIANNHEVVHWSFDGHNPHTRNHISKLNDEQLRAVDPFLDLANKNIQRRWPTSNVVVNNLLRRNFYQVYWSDSVYAVSSFVNDNSMLQIYGGTAWACQMFMDRWLYKVPPTADVPIYLFDQISNTWYTWSGKWKAISTPPNPTGVYAGIGSRKLTNEGRDAITAVYR